MAEPRFKSEELNPILTQVYEGMTVHDRTGDKIGTVKYVYLGELIDSDEGYDQGPDTPSAYDSSEGSLIEDFARAIALTEHISDPWREQLLCHGFIRIHSIGLFAADRYAMPGQIASVADDRVMLCVSRNELIKA
jgi:hypothetical protein